MLETVSSRYPRARSPGTCLHLADVGAAWSSPRSSLSQFGVERDRRVQHFRHRTVLLGLAGDLGKTGIIEVRHLGAQGQRRLADLESLTFGIERDRGLGGELGRREAGELKTESQRHREAAGVCGCDQFLGIGALLVLEAR